MLPSQLGEHIPDRLGKPPQTGPFRGHTQSELCLVPLLGKLSVIFPKVTGWPLQLDLQIFHPLLRRQQGHHKYLRSEPVHYRQGDRRLPREGGWREEAHDKYHTNYPHAGSEEWTVLGAGETLKEESRHNLFKHRCCLVLQV